MHRNFTVIVALQPPKPVVIDNSVFLRKTDISLNFECSFFEGYTEVFFYRAMILQYATSTNYAIVYWCINLVRHRNTNR